MPETPSIKNHGPYDLDAVHAWGPSPHCLICGITMEKAAAIHREWMLGQAFDRLASVLEKLEKKL